MSDKELSHLEQLKLKHRDLDKKIKEGYTSYLSDDSLYKMKQQKLMLKDEIERLENTET